MMHHLNTTMASSTCTSLLFFFVPFLIVLILSLSSTSLSQQSFRPKALILPVIKDAATLQYSIQIKQRTPLVPVNLVVDLGGRYLWTVCGDSYYVSSTYRLARCGSAQCALAPPHGCGRCSSSDPPGCIDTCALGPDNPISMTGTSGDLGTDVVSLLSTDGSNPGRAVTLPNFLFVCSSTFPLQGLASGAQGMAGLGRTKISLPSQFSSTFSFDRKFGVCLSSSTTYNGIIIFGDGPYNLLPAGIDVSMSLTFTPLLINPISTAPGYLMGEPSYEYFIGLKSITVEKPLALNSTLLSFDREGYGGTKISTVHPYSVFETSIFTALTKAFASAAAARNITRVASVAPFELCFSSKNVAATRLGPSVPFINLVLHNKNTVWTITGSNSMVQVSNDVMCLGFVDGGVRPRTSIVLGGHQLEDNLLQFDLAASRVGFSSSLLGRQTTCANFNFTANP